MLESGCPVEGLPHLPEYISSRTLFYSIFLMHLRLSKVDETLKELASNHQVLGSFTFESLQVINCIFDLSNLQVFPYRVNPT